jgi:hypothetical protein
VKPAILASVLFIILLAGSSSAAILNYWTLNNVNTDVISANDISSKNATFTTTYPTYNTSGTGATHALDFEKDSGDGALTTSDPYAGLTTFSISVWYDIEGTTPTLVRFVGNEYSGSDRGLTIGIDGGGAINACFATSSGSAYDHCMYSAAPNTTAGFHHLLWVRNGAASTLYLDGVSKDTATGTTAAVRNPTGSAQAWIGRQFGLYSLDGILDEIQIYNTALNATEISNLYNYGNITGSPAAPPAAGATNQPSWVAPTPADSSTVNWTFTLNASCGSNTTFMWVYNGTTNTTALSNSTTGNYTQTVTTTANYTYSAACYNLTTGLSNYTTARTAVYVPLTPGTPTLYYSFSNSTPATLANTQFSNFSAINNSVENSVYLWVRPYCDQTDMQAYSYGYRRNSPASSWGSVWSTVWDGDNNVTTAAAGHNLSSAYASNYRFFWWNASCYNATTLTYSSWISYNFTVDYNAPTLTINPSNEFKYDNLSNGNPYDNNLSINLTFNDNNELYAYEMNISRLDNGTSYNYTSAIITGTSYNYAKSINTTNWTSGAYNVYLAVADAHTDDKIDDYDTEARMSEVIFNTAEGNRLSILADDEADTRTTKYPDRYSFEFTFTDRLEKERVFHVTSDKPITYLPKSKYKAHFVIMNERAGQGGNWVDFEGVDGKPIVTKISEYHYTVELPNLDARSEFNSIGGLNTYTANYMLYIGELSFTEPDAYHLFPFDFTMYASTYSAETHNATLTYDGTLYNANRSVGVCAGLYCEPNETHTVNDLTKSYADYNYSWKINTTLGDGNKTINYINGTHTVANWAIYANASCYGSTEERIRFYSYLEDYPSTLWNATAEMYLNYTIDPSANVYQQSNLTYTANDTFSVCVRPTNLTFVMDNYVKFIVSGGFTHRYYDQQATYANNTLTNISLYNFNDTTGISSLRITARDSQTYSYKLNILGLLQRFYVGEGVWRTVQYDRSGDYGLINFDIKEETTDYRVLYYDEDNNLLLQTQSVKFSCSGGVCDVTQILTDASAGGSPTSGVTAVYSFNNATKILTINWTGPAASTSDVDIRVTHETMANQQVACSASQSGNAGTYSCNLTGYNSAFFVTVTDVTDGDSIIVLNSILQKARRAISDNLSIADQSGIGFLVLLVISSLGLFSPVAVILGSVVGMLVLSLFGFVSVVLVPTVILALAIGIVISLKVKQ